MQWKLSTSKTNLYCSETLRRNSLENNTLLLIAMESFLNVCEKFLSGKGKEGLSLNAPLFEMSVKFCGKNYIQKLNRDYRGKDTSTDVLSFPIFENIREKEKRDFPQGPLELGDIVICVDVAKKQSFEFEIGLEQEIIQLLLHGFLHLCGYDHEISPEEERLMFGLEDQLMEKIWKKSFV